MVGFIQPIQKFFGVIITLEGQNLDLDFSAFRPIVVVVVVVMVSTMMVIERSTIIITIT